MATDNKTPKRASHAKNNNKTNQPDEQQLKVISAVGYLPFLMFPKEKFAVFHANQSLILLIFAAIFNIVVMPILGVITLGLGFLLMPILWLIVLAYLVIGIVNSMNGHMKRLPIIGGFDILKYEGDK